MWFLHVWKGRGGRYLTINNQRATGNNQRGAGNGRFLINKPYITKIKKWSGDQRKWVFNKLCEFRLIR
ncbi:MAG: hypothetical protein DWQ04_21150 [Chloroflexi bacterium]|nr:MAG: hypothetical protein DWQ04_21150 [Chloroflexota bacterium]